MSWLYLDGADQKGPISDSDLATLESAGTITDHTLVWREGMAEWQPYGQAKAGAVKTVTAAGTATAGTVTCVECGRLFLPSEVIRQGNVYICADCKPAFVQKLKEGVAPKGPMDYAGFGVRGGSVILDGLLMWIVILPLNFMMVRTLGRSAAVLNFFVNLTIGAAYYVFFLGRFGATLGKMANKLVVVNPDGSKIGYGKAVGRYFAANWVSGLFTVGIGYLMAAWDGEKRALHDRICGTRVIRKR